MYDLGLAQATVDLYNSNVHPHTFRQSSITKRCKLA